MQGLEKLVARQVHLPFRQYQLAVEWSHDQEGAWEGQILRLTFRPCRMPDETWVGYKIRTSRFMRVCWRKMGLPLLKENIASEIWTSMTWAVYDGDVPIMLALRSILGWRTTAWWRSRSSCGMAWDPNNVQRWKHNVGFHDWIELMTQTRLRKEDVIRNLLESMKQPVDTKKESKDLCRQRNHGICLPLTLEHQYQERNRHWKSKGTIKGY